MSRFVAALTVIVVPADIDVLATLDTVTLFPAPINTSLSKANINKKFKNPTPFYPQPTKDNYKLGEFQRYFCVKANELKYTEVTKEQYEKFKNKDQSVAWQYYIAFTLPWDISGEKDKVYKTNRNIVLITEQNIKRRGLQEFLRKNYLKFYKEA